MKKEFILCIYIICAISLFLTSCSIFREDVEIENKSEEIIIEDEIDDVLDTGPSNGGVLNLFSTTSDTLNPLLTSNAYVKEYGGFIYESLIGLDATQKPVPLLGESWEVSKDGLMWTFKIKDNIFWHDDVPLSAEDVEFTLKTIIQNSDRSPYSTNVENISAYTVVDRSTIKIMLKSPNSFTPELMNFPILPKHYYGSEDILNTPKNFRPLGTGPFKFSEYRENSIIKFTNNEKWWQGKVSDTVTLPYLKEIRINIFSPNASVANAFQTGDSDVLALDRSGWIRYSGRADITLKKYNSNKFEFIAFNLTNKILKDPAVRKAISCAVDRGKIIDDILPGEAVVADVPVVPECWLYDSGVSSYNVDKEKARQILKDGGWNESNGFLYKRISGVSTQLKLEILVNDDNELRNKVAETISRQLKEIGINLVVKKVKWEEQFNSINKRRFDMAFVGCTVTTSPDISFLYSSHQIGIGLNIAGYHNEDVDRYLEDIKSQNDENKKRAMFANMKGIIDEEVPYLGLYFYRDALIYNKRIRGEFNPSIWNKYFNITKWYIPK